MTFSQSLSQRIWRGDKSTIAEAEAKFLADSEAGLLNFACVLYSFRQKEYCRQRLSSLQDHLVGLLKSWTPERGGNEADMLTTYVLWLTRHFQMSERKRGELQQLLKQVLFQATEAKNMPSNEPHTQALLGLTAAKLAEDLGDRELREFAGHHVYLMQKHIQDAKQLARVLRGLGVLTRKQGSYRASWHWFKRALSVKGVPRAVHLKTLAAFFGIER